MKIIKMEYSKYLNKLQQVKFKARINFCTNIIRALEDSAYLDARLEGLDDDDDLHIIFTKIKELKNINLKNIDEEDEDTSTWKEKWRRALIWRFHDE